MPSWDLFEKTAPEYQDTVLSPDDSPRMAVEAGLPTGWERYVGSGGAIIGISRFGASAPGGVVMEKCGFTAEAIAQKALEMLK